MILSVLLMTALIFSLLFIVFATVRCILAGFYVRVTIRPFRFSTLDDGWEHFRELAVSLFWVLVGWMLFFCTMLLNRAVDGPLGT